MSILDRLTPHTPEAPKGASAPATGATGAVAPPAGGAVPTPTPAPPAPAYSGSTPRVHIDISEGEVLGFISKLAVALGHSQKYGSGESFTISSQVRAVGGAPISGALSINIYREGHIPS